MNTLIDSINDLFSWARNNDPETSKMVGKDKKVQLRWGSQRASLLIQYIDNDLSDEEAGDASGLRSNRSCCYWKRCSELRQMGLIEDTGEVKVSEAGQKVQVCRITELGKQKINEINPNK
jgi:hypothetical protein